MRAVSGGFTRLSLSLAGDLSRQLDVMVEERGLSSRSRLIAELIRHAVADHEALTRPDEVVTVTITLMYRGDKGHVRQQVALAQADYAREVISSQHVSLQDDQSLEALLVQGAAWRVKMLCEALRQVSGVRQLTLVATSSLLSPLHDQSHVTHVPTEAAA